MKKTLHGPLTQRLMAVREGGASLTKWQCQSLTHFFLWQAFLDDPNGSYTKPLRQVNASQNYHISPATLEARIKEELISLGLLEPQEVSQHAILV